MDVWTAVGYVVLGALLGLVGQMVRVVVGLKKLQDEAGQVVQDKVARGTIRQLDAGSFRAETRTEYHSRYDSKRFRSSLGISAVIGAIAGTLAAVQVLDSVVTRELLLFMIAAGYSGTDFIEGVMKKQLPKS